jgi:hypothetical protein
MKNLFFIVVTLVLFVSFCHSQRIVMQQNFETTGFTSPDSLPPNWVEFDEDNSNPSYPNAKWKARDTGTTFPGVNVIVKSQAHNSLRGMSIPWRAGDPVADDWVFTDSLSIITGDSLIFWMLLGTPIDSIIPNLTHYKDSMQVQISNIPAPNIGNTKLTTIVSLDSDNVWTEYKFSLSAFAGQTIYIVFRYYMNTTVDGLWCNIDDIFVGNRSAIGIKPISSNIPKTYALSQNYPNPFNPITNINFDLPRKDFVNLIIFNSLGQVVQTLVNETKEAGSYKVDFNASNLPSGAYFYRISAGSFVDTKKMILVK